MTITNFTRPHHLKKGDTIGILSTARAIEIDELKAAKTFIRSQGYNVIYGATIGARDNQFAGDDELRLNDLQTMLDNPQISAIICARGGYGTARLLENIDWAAFKENPKWILGYSDITALHSTISGMKIMSLHGIMPVNIKDDESKTALQEALKLMSGAGVFSLNLPEHQLTRPAEAKGMLTGGNLSMIYSMRGTRYDIIPEGRILFLEDLDEYLYHIDRMMVNFKNSDLLRNFSAVVVGGMTDMNDNTIPFGHTAEEIIAEHVPEDIPLFFGASFGHFSKNMPMVCGAKATITKESNTWKLTYQL